MMKMTRREREGRELAHARVLSINTLPCLRSTRTRHAPRECGFTIVEFREAFCRAFFFERVRESKNWREGGRRARCVFRLRRRSTGGYRRRRRRAVFPRFSLGRAGVRAGF